ncbi:MAG: FAD-dependent oxidoreductase [Deltaproteobacteria bacterium]|nr:FAD-dependent oxidoreductase [Deltaproteobacteria bacterium]
MEKLDVIIVGGGLAGLSCAYGLKNEGLNVLVLERGEFPGSKNMTGGRLYLKPIKPLIGDMLEGAPFERKVVRERWSFLGKDNESLTLDFISKKLKEEEHSYTVLRAKFDKYLSEKVSNSGIFVIPKYRVDGILKDNGRVEGVYVGGERLYARVVVIAEGVLSQLTRKLGMKKELSADSYAVGVKEIIELPEHRINERFNVGSGEGVAHLFVGDVTGGVFGGGFLYTNKESISIGVVVKISSLMDMYPSMKIYELLERFKDKDEVKNLIAGGNTVEYSAHIIPESGLKGVEKLYGNGFLITGDAAGFALNMGITVRGMDFAIASGFLAADTIKEAFRRGDFSERVLSGYMERLSGSFVLKDLKSFEEMPSFLDNKDFFGFYPSKMTEIFGRLVYFGEEPKERIWKTLKDWGKDFLRLRNIKTLLRVRKI